MLMGAHHASAVVRAPFQCFWLLTLIYLAFILRSCQALSKDAIALIEAQSLIKVKASLRPNDGLVNWNQAGNPPPCAGNTSTWKGVICSKNRVWGLSLQKMGMSGKLDLDALMHLHKLRILSIFNNSFGGPLPDLKRLPTLRSVYFSNNRFSGSIPDDTFVGMNQLRRLFLSNNSLTGRIPSSLTTIHRLTEMRLEDNQFEGNLPNFTRKQLTTVNVSNNHLEGPIPILFSNMSAKSFSGNKCLCGPPLGPCPIYDASSWRIFVIILVVILLLLVLAILVVGLLAAARKRKDRNDKPCDTENSREIATDDDKSKISEGATCDEVKGAVPGGGRIKKSDAGKLVFLRDGMEEFDLAELLRASAEVLGSGSFGSSYKAVLPSGKEMVVKRFRHMSRVVRREFHEHVTRLANLQHPNVLPFLAYYYRKEEKLFVSEFIGNGSLASKLHGNLKGKELDWPRRLRIIQGVTKGLAFLHSELHNLEVPHGHLKSSNVLLNQKLEPILMDYGLIPLINPDHAHKVILGYKSPDFFKRGSICKKTDVWGLGILILEVLTGRFPTSSLTVGKDEGLERWVDEIAAQEEKDHGSVFDKDMAGVGAAKDEVEKLLGIGLGCCEQDLNKRFDIREAIRKIEDVKTGRL